MSGVKSIKLFRERDPTPSIQHDLLIKAKLGFVWYKFLIDTGADKTLVNYCWIKRCGLKKRMKVEPWMEDHPMIMGYIPDIKLRCPSTVRNKLVTIECDIYVTNPKVSTYVLLFGRRDLQKYGSFINLSPRHPYLEVSASPLYTSLPQFQLGCFEINGFSVQAIIDTGAQSGLVLTDETAIACGLTLTELDEPIPTLGVLGIDFVRKVCKNIKIIFASKVFITDAYICNFWGKNKIGNPIIA